MDTDKSYYARMGQVWELCVTVCTVTRICIWGELNFLTDDYKLRIELYRNITCSLLLLHVYARMYT